MIVHLPNGPAVAVLPTWFVDVLVSVLALDGSPHDIREAMNRAAPLTEAGWRHAQRHTEQAMYDAVVATGAVPYRTPGNGPSGWPAEAARLYSAHEQAWRANPCTDTVRAAAAAGVIASLAAEGRERYAHAAAVIAWIQPAAEAPPHLSREGARELELLHSILGIVEAEAVRPPLPRGGARVSPDRACGLNY